MRKSNIEIFSTAYKTYQICIHRRNSKIFSITKQSYEEIIDITKGKNKEFINFAENFKLTQPFFHGFLISDRDII